jgi:hypothetical protein
MVSPRSQEASVTTPPAATLKLVSEDPDAARRAAADAAGLAGATGSAPDEPGADAGGELLTNVKRCISVGPFRDVAESRARREYLARRRLRPAAARGRRRGVGRCLGVSSGSCRSRAGEIRLLAKLKAAGHR